MLTGIQEIWAPNAFVANSLRGIFSGPISVVPYTVDIGTGPYPTRDQLGMEPGRFYFLFSFDYYSSPYRKNPLGAVKAFQSAFPRGDENVGLIIKSIGAAVHYPEIKQRISDAAVADSRIVVIDRSLTRRDFLGLIFASDAYLSLHRSEGFGSGMAEAMSFGRSVIGTNFSGNTDFLTEETGFPIPFTLRPVLPHEYSWSEGQLWAEPDLEAAVSAMKLVLQAPDTVRNRAAAGQQLIRQKYGPARVGQIFRDRIGRLMKL
jgi:glycosyltransferase involved in cell wall biosynthesis